MKIYVLSTVIFGIDIIQTIQKEMHIDGVIGLSQNSNANVSGYIYMKDFADKNNIPFIEVNSYNLSGFEDKKKLENLNIDLLFVIGWQRLVPAWLISRVNFSVVGAHGSHVGITKGRGRSPLNWALILGKTKFIVSIFKINKDIDDGNIIETGKFPISKFDDIRTLYYKSCILISEMLVKYVHSGFKKRKTVQTEADARYLPKRIPEDGAIDWNRSSEDIYNFVRALTKPYPGAYSFLRKAKVLIWKARPFTFYDSNRDEPGVIKKIFENNKLLVKCGKGLLLIDEYCIEPPFNQKQIKINEQFNSVDFVQQTKDIISRHIKKTPNLLVNEDLARI